MPNPLSTASLRVQPRRNAAARSGPAIAANAVLLGRGEERRDDPLGLGDRAQVLEVHPDLAAPAHGDDRQVGRMRDVEAERFDDARPSIELGLAHGRGPEPQRPGRLAQQVSQDLPQRGPAPGEPSALARRTNRAARARSSSESTASSGPGSTASTSGSPRRPASSSTTQTRTSSESSPGMSAPGSHSRSEGRPDSRDVDVALAWIEHEPRLMDHRPPHDRSPP